MSYKARITSPEFGWHGHPFSNVSSKSGLERQKVDDLLSPHFEDIPAHLFITPYRLEENGIVSVDAGRPLRFCYHLNTAFILHAKLALAK